MARKNRNDAAVEELRAFGLTYPGAHTKSPWPGHLDLAVNDKTFAFLSAPGEPLSISCKLPHSGDAALALPFVKPTAYGLGKSGWVSAAFPEQAAIPIELFKQWIDESYRALAPRRLAAGVPPLSLDSVGEAPRVIGGAASAPATEPAAPARANASKKISKKARATEARSTVKQSAARAAAAPRAVAQKRPTSRRPAATSRSKKASVRTGSNGAKPRASAR
jgi:YjbR